MEVCTDEGGWHDSRIEEELLAASTKSVLYVSGVDRIFSRVKLSGTLGKVDRKLPTRTQKNLSDLVLFFRRAKVTNKKNQLRKGPFQA